MHRSQLEPQDVTARAGIPVTSVARTLLDLARTISHDELTRALRESQFRRIFDLDEALEVVARRPCRPLRALLDDFAPTQSHLEDRLLDICDRHRIERPLTQQPLLGRRVDFLWPHARLVVETDGWEAHHTRAAFQADRNSTNRLQLAGYSVLRFTYSDVARRPAQVAGLIRDALARRRASEP